MISYSKIGQNLNILERRQQIKTAYIKKVPTDSIQEIPATIFFKIVCLNIRHVGT
jgi:hypothetical protein